MFPCETAVPGGRMEVAASCPGGVKGVDLLNEGIRQDVVFTCKELVVI